MLTAPFQTRSCGGFFFMFAPNAISVTDYRLCVKTSVTPIEYFVELFSEYQQSNPATIAAGFPRCFVFGLLAGL